MAKRFVFALIDRRTEILSPSRDWTGGDKRLLSVREAADLIYTTHKHNLFIKSTGFIHQSWGQFHTMKASGRSEKGFNQFAKHAGLNQSTTPKDQLIILHIIQYIHRIHPHDTLLSGCFINMEMGCHG